MARLGLMVAGERMFTLFRKVSLPQGPVTINVMA
jgi:hypothetical protein